MAAYKFAAGPGVDLDALAKELENDDMARLAPPAPPLGLTRALTACALRLASRRFNRSRLPAPTWTACSAAR